VGGVELRGWTVDAVWHCGVGVYKIVLLRNVED
jgi:hypothetical protein